MSESSGREILEAVGRLAVTMAGFQETMSSIQTDVRETRTETRAAVDGIRLELHDTRAALMGRIDRLQDALELVRRDITVNFASSDRALANSKRTQDDIHALSDVVSAMQKQYRVLASQVEELQRDRFDRPFPPTGTNGPNG